MPDPNDHWAHLAEASGPNADGTYTAVISLRLRVPDETALRAANVVPLVDSNDTPDWGAEFAATRSVSEAIRTANYGELTPVGADMWVGSATAAIPEGQFSP